ncbi:glycerol kinase [Thiorhodospira sibirica]|uniref:glycerol kinase n=1 Tax=Thiorhodospira sibirica TaxID=154347 RepID=UPI0003092C0E|nr:glycerol kinase [Thiorhodospira sibirica]
MKLVSTTTLSKSLGLSAKELFEYLLERGFIEKNNDSWALTAEGQAIGGEYRNSEQYGKYIVWPENLDLNIENGEDSTEKIKMVTATVIGRSFELSANKINFIFSELGWLNKGIKGWVLTEQGKKQGGLQAEDKKSGIPFVRWPEAIIESKSLKETIGHVKGTEEEKTPESKKSEPDDIGFREKFEAKHRAADGHFVRSKAEMLIDNWLYMAEIVHAYERKLPIEEDVYSDFYIPTGKVYIEYWGYENDPKYLARKEKKIELYRKYGFNLIELQDKDVQNLDDILPRMLLKYGVQAY